MSLEDYRSRIDAIDEEIVKKLEEEPDMLKRYRAFLSSGGSDYPVELLRKAGIEVGEAVEICMKEFAEALKEFEALA